MDNDNIFLGMTVLFFISFMEMTRLISNVHGIVFGIEILLFFSLLFVALIVSLGLYFEASWAFAGSMILFGGMFLNALYFYTTPVALLVTNIHAFTIVFGFLVSLINLRTYEDYEEDFVYEASDYRPEKVVTKVVAKEKTAASNKTFSPGKFVGSKTGKKYHSPKCDWAKKIGKKNREWLQDAKDAKDKGYKPCKCVK